MLLIQIHNSTFYFQTNTEADHSTKLPHVLGTISFLQFLSFLSLSGRPQLLHSIFPQSWVFELLSPHFVQLSYRVLPGLWSHLPLAPQKPNGKVGASQGDSVASWCGQFVHEVGDCKVPKTPGTERFDQRLTKPPVLQPWNDVKPTETDAKPAEIVIS